MIINKQPSDLSSLKRSSCLFLAHISWASGKCWSMLASVKAQTGRKEKGELQTSLKGFHLRVINIFISISIDETKSRDHAVL